MEKLYFDHIILYKFAPLNIVMRRLNTYLASDNEKKKICHYLLLYIFFILKKKIILVIVLIQK